MSGRVIPIGQDSEHGNPVLLPLDIATETISIVARKGAGKTHTARCLAESFLFEGVQTVIIDPLDVWWGLRLTKKGKPSNLNVVIFGGDHADLPLTENMGRHLAALVVNRGLSIVLVLDHLSLSAQRRLVADFAEELFQLKAPQDKRTPLHIIVDEADAFAPQRVQPDQTRCLGAVDRLVRRGRSRGIGTTCITQRPAVLSKDVLTQTEILISLQVTAPQDRNALTDWIKANTDGEEAGEFLGSLAGLRRGEAWLWSPSKLQMLRRLLVRDTTTYDSSYTPKIGEKRAAAPAAAYADLDAVRQELAAVLEEAEGNDPAKLKARIRQLEQDLKKRPIEIDKGVLVDAIKKALEERDREWQQELGRVRETVGKMLGNVSVKWTAPAVAHALQASAKASDASRLDDSSRLVRPGPIKPLDRDPLPVYPVGSIINTTAGAKLPRAEHLILTALVQHGDCEKNKLAILTGYAHSGGGFNNALSALRSRGLIMPGAGGGIAITSSGRVCVGPVTSFPVEGAPLREHWCRMLGKAERSILEALARSGALSKVNLASAAGYEPGGGGFNNALSKLRTLGLIHGSIAISIATELR